MIIWGDREHRIYRAGLHHAFRIVQKVRSEQAKIRGDAKKRGHLDTEEECSYAESILLRCEEAISSAKKELMNVQS